MFLSVTYKAKTHRLYQLELFRPYGPPPFVVVLPDAQTTRMASVVSLAVVLGGDRTKENEFL